MNTTSPTRAQPAAARLDQIGSENTFLSWIRRNGSILGVGVVALVAGVLISQIRTSGRAGRERDAWDVYQTLRTEPGSFAAARLPAALDRAREHELAYPWVVLAALNSAFTAGDKEALRLLQPELDALVKDGSLDGLYMVAGGERVAALSYLQGQVEKELQGAASLPDFTLPPPSGRRVKITISTDTEQSYDVIVGLYEEAAPLTCERFLAAVAAGSLAGTDADWVYSGLRLRGLGAGAETPEPLALEARWGYFRDAEVLATQVKAGAGEGLQDGEQFFLLLEDDHAMDGQTTVFGRVVDSSASLEAIRALLPGEEDLAKAPPKFKLQSAALVE